MFELFCRVADFLKTKLSLPEHEIETRTQAIINYSSALGMLLIVPILYKQFTHWRVTFTDKLNIVIMFFSLFMAVSCYVNIAFEKVKIMMPRRRESLPTNLNESFARAVAYFGLVFASYQALQYGFVVDCVTNPYLRELVPQPMWKVVILGIVVAVSTSTVILKSVAVLKATK